MTGSSQTLELPGDRWVQEITYRGLQAQDAGRLNGFLASMRGVSGRVVLHALWQLRIQGNAGGNPLVNGAGQTGRVINLDGFTAASTLKAGDMISVAGELRMVAVDATANGSGQMSVTLDVPLRATPADNAAVVLTKATTTWKLQSNEMGWEVGPTQGANPFIDITFVLEEAWS